MISIGSFRPEYFNNNGDQGNIEVLTYSLRAAKINYIVKDQIELENDFVLVGDASIAAMNHFEAELLELVPVLASRLEAGLATLLVGRPYELLAKHLGIDLQLGARRSEFMKITTDFGEVFGYHNSEVVEPRLFVKGNFLGTTLFGPVLAKNPSLLKMLLDSIGSNDDLEPWQLEIPSEISARTTFG